MSKIIAVDFDGTLCQGNCWPYIGAPNELIISYILSQQRSGAKIILWTNRTGEALEAAVNWCLDYGIKFDAINENVPETLGWLNSEPRKIFAHEYLDDRAKNPEDLSACYADNQPVEFLWERQVLQGYGENYVIVNGEYYYKKEEE